MNALLSHVPTQVLLGIIAGGTIFLGLPIALLPDISSRAKGFLNAMSTGILVFLLVEIVGKVLEQLEELFQSASHGYPTLPDALTFSSLLIVGLALGLLGMVYFEQAYIRGGKDKTPTRSKALQVSMMIAIGIGLHNLTEGMAIAQAYSWGDQRLALFLAIGFGLHNATEGFGIAAPLSGQQTYWSRLCWMGLIGGGPTFLGTIVGSYWQSDPFRMFTFGLAAGAILYIVGELLHIGRSLKGEAVVEIGLLAGFTLAFATEMFLAMNGA
ncbi:MAG: ZIP family metal transporter [Elusimicrobia bacterium]|nr:ZIP family metal transporter [Elusimicrobiota bacterium]